MSPRVLIVDDNLELAENMREMIELDDTDVHVEVVTTGEDAVALVDREGFDLVITDMRLPGMNGAEVLSSVRVRRPDTPVVVMTAFAEDELLERARRTGAVGVLVKPADLDRICGLVRLYTRD